MEDSEPKSVNLKLDIIGVNSLRLGGLHIILQEKLSVYCIFDEKYP